MKKKSIITVLLLSIIAQSHGMFTNVIKNNRINNNHAQSNDLKPYIIEFSGGIFSPTNCIPKNIYGSAWGSFQFKLSVSLIQNSDLWKRLYAFAAINYTTKGGRSTNGNQKTRIRLIPISFGLRFIQPASAINNRLSVYAGLGIQAIIERVNNDSAFVDRKAHKSGVGGIAELGFYFHPCQKGLIILGLDYSFTRLGCYKPCTENVIGFSSKTSGIGFHVGLGAAF